ncbi:hypothetical protein [Pelagibius sp. Alg239-R121]|uniref:hypothetical protein n=1 Tax=Pelagibius sp. Alg239-R121 TaxID=2993448 RepID=UPI0024A6F100|nr:hypothetical protein [Pelagibius sp. Alg239-R121]
MSFSFDEFVAAVRGAAKEPDPNLSVRTLLEKYVSDPSPIITHTPEDGEDEVMLFEDDALSIWRCRFRPHVIMPPHEHRVIAHIGTYSGEEKNILFRRGDGQLKHKTTKIVGPGDVLSLNKDCIHAVSANGDICSLSLHIYMGPLMKLKRGLFDWETGVKSDFSLENFDRLKRPASALPAY